MEFGSHALPLALLLGAMAAFLLSTIPLAPLTRFIVWALGTALLFGAGFLMLNASSGVHIFPTLAEAVTAPSGKSWLFDVFARNMSYVGDFFGPLLDLFLLFGCVVALLALIAFTPGEGIERVARVTIFLLIGGVLGGVVALTSVAIGFGNYPLRAAYFGKVAPDDVYDGDTFTLGNAPIRLAGIDALELSQTCLRGPEVIECGKTARAQLQNYLKDNIVVCRRVSRNSGRPAPAPNSDEAKYAVEEVPAQTPDYEKDKYGRVLATCEIAEGAAKGTDVGRELVQFGHAMAEPDDERYRDAENEARSAGRGLWQLCSLKPSVWRGDAWRRDAFTKQHVIMGDNDVVDRGRCEPTPAAAAPPEETPPPKAPRKTPAPPATPS